MLEVVLLKLRIVNLGSLKQCRTPTGEWCSLLGELEESRRFWKPQTSGKACLLTWVRWPQGLVCAWLIVVSTELREEALNPSYLIKETSLIPTD